MAFQFRNRNSNSQSGMTLVEIMIALSLIAILALAMITIMQQGIQGQKTVSEAFDFLQLRTEVFANTYTKATCDGSFRDAVGAPATIVAGVDNIAEIRNGLTNSIIAKEDQEYGGAVIDKILMQYQKDIGGVDIPPIVNSPAPGETTHLMELLFSVSRVAGQGGAISNSKAPIRISVVTNAANQIVSCIDPYSTAPTTPADSLWVPIADACPAGMISALITDDWNAAHELNEGGGCANQIKLCVGGGITNVAWTAPGACPAGYFQTTLVDDTGDPAVICEDNGTGPNRVYCIEGITAEDWAPDCLPGWKHLGGITDHDPAVHRTFEGGGGLGVYKFCVK